MAVAVAAVAPTTLFAGDVLSWRVPADGYSAADGFTASVMLAGRETSTAVPCVAEGRDWIVTIPPAVSASLAEGEVRWVVRVSDNDGPRSLASGLFRVYAVPKTGAGIAGASHAERMVALWEARAEQQAQDILAEYDNGGRRAKRYDPEQIRRELTYWRAEVAAERNGGRAPMRAYSVRF